MDLFNDSFLLFTRLTFFWYSSRLLDLFLERGKSGSGFYYGF